MTNPFFGVARSHHGVPGKQHDVCRVQSADALSGIHLGELEHQHGPRDLLLVLWQGPVAGQVRPDAERDLHLVPQHGARLARRTTMRRSSRRAGHGRLRISRTAISMSYHTRFRSAKARCSWRTPTRPWSYCSADGRSSRSQLIHSGTPLSVSQTNANTGCNGCGQLPTATGRCRRNRPDRSIQRHQWLAESRRLLRDAGLFIRQRQPAAERVFAAAVQHRRLALQDRDVQGVL